MANHLSSETSPYLLQHKNNPVDWYPWGKEALERARIEDKPIFLSIGYSACHWCHVMAHESFENQEIAQILNRDFISIKVDREERPDLDSIYMAAVVALTGQGGWPMSLFLNPDGKPFYGGTYFPPQPRYGIPSFREVLVGIQKTWREDRGQLDQVAQKLTVQIRQSGIRSQGQYQLSPETIQLAIEQLTSRYDWINGGWGKAPKFPQPMAIEFLLRQAARGKQDVFNLINHALTAMSRGGMYDVVGGGFHRYSTDDQWLIPHFEKMLYDNALLGQVYLHAYLLTGNSIYREVCTETLDFIVRELMDPSGGFYSSLDADVEGEEGKTYLWSTKEIQTVLTDPNQFNLFSIAYNLKGAGNFEGKWVLQQQLDDVALSKQFTLQPNDIHQQLKDARHRLLASRQTRSKPGTDDKVLAFWNALTLTTFAEAGQYLQREDYLEIARKNASFTLDNLIVDGRLHRSWRRGTSTQNAFLEDYAGVILGLIALYQVDSDPRWFQSAFSLTKEMVSHFKDTTGGFFDTRDDHDPLIIRPKEYQDNATPSGNSMAAMALLKLSEFIPEQTAWNEIAIQQLSKFQEMATQYPTAFSYWLAAMDFAIYPVRQIAILRSSDDSEYTRMVEVVLKMYRPDTIMAIASYPPPPESAPILFDKPLLNQQTTAYLCEGFTCKQPVTTSTELESQLSKT